MSGVPTSTLEVTNQIQKYWAPQFMKELRSDLPLIDLVSKDYQGDMKKEGDTVYVSQINAATGELLTVGTNADSFSAEAVSLERISVTANKRAVASFKITELGQLQSQLDSKDSELMAALRHGVSEKINNYLYSLVAPSTSNPDHSIASVTDFNAAALASYRLLAAKAKWPKDGRWFALLDPSYYSDVLNAATLTSSDYGASDAPVIGGQMALKRFGFNIVEDNSAGCLTMSPGAAGADTALLFHPDFMHLCMQKEVQVKVSDLHPLGQFGYLVSVDVIFGAALGIDGNVKHIKVYAT